MDELKKIIQEHTPDIHNRRQFFNGAVMIALTHHEGELCFILQKRSSNLKRNPGEISFPGGRIEEFEWKTPREAALRETEEELGVSHDKIEVWGCQSFLVNTAGVLVYAYIGYIPEKEELQPSSQEVEEIIYIPVQYFMKHQPKVSYLETKIMVPDDFPFQCVDPSYEEKWKNQCNKHVIYFYQWKDIVIWGLTAGLIYEFTELFQEGLKLTEEEKE